MHFLPPFVTILLAAVLICATVYMCEVAFDEDKNVDKYTISVRKAIHRIPQMPKSVSPFEVIASVKMESKYRTAPKRRLENCMVKQNMDYLLQGTYCYLFDSDAFLSNNSNISSKEWKTNRFCSGMNEMANTTLHFSTVMANRETIFITRDPLERFARWYLESCENNTSCYGCENALCVVEKVHREILKASKTYKYTGGILRGPDQDPVLLAPQTWNCDLWNRGQYFTFIRHGEDSTSWTAAIKGIMRIFKKNGVQEDQLDLIKDSLSEDLSKEDVDSSKIEEMKKTIYNSQKHLDQFVNAYYYDYVVFDYAIPDM